jgi:hypothetical protein
MFACLGTVKALQQEAGSWASVAAALLLFDRLLLLDRLCNSHDDDS